MRELERGLMYKEGNGVKQSYKEAKKWFEIAAEKRDVLAFCHLGMMYEDGLGVEKDLGKTFQYYGEAAKMGLPWAQCRMGLLLAQMGGEYDKKAVAFYRMAAKQGDKDAQFNLGMMLAHGRGEEKNISEALTWLDKASTQGHNDAVLWGIMLRDELDDTDCATPKKNPIY